MALKAAGSPLHGFPTNPKERIKLNKSRAVLEKRAELRRGALQGGRGKWQWNVGISSDSTGEYNVVDRLTKPLDKPRGGALLTLHGVKLERNKERGNLFCHKIRKERKPHNRSREGSWWRILARTLKNEKDGTEKIGFMQGEKNQKEGLFLKEAKRPS